MVVKTLSVDLRERGIAVVGLHPGWVRTAMGGEAAPLSVEESVAALRTTIAALTLADSGGFLSYDGADIPW
jgi:NAD(P)-dependent dehydrogenase (short-subunit alcohol dehydrogenase family)